MPPKTQKISEQNFINAASLSDIATITAYLKAGGNVNARTRYQETALHFAASLGGEVSHQIIILLRRYNASNTLQDIKGKTPGEYAINSITRALLTSPLETLDEIFRTHYPASDGNLIVDDEDEDVDAEPSLESVLHTPLSRTPSALSVASLSPEKNSENTSAENSPQANAVS